MFAHTCLSHCRGSWQAARDSTDRGLAVSPREARLLGNRVLLEYELGDFSQGQIYLERLLEVVQLTEPGPTLEHAFLAVVIPAVARITGVATRFEVYGDPLSHAPLPPGDTPYMGRCRATAVTTSNN